MSKCDDGWEYIFEEIDATTKLHHNGRFTISANEIKDITKKKKGLGQQEPRLMTKFDTRESRPKILAQNNTTILATSNGHYSVIQGDGYHDLEDILDIKQYQSSQLSNLETLPPVCASESQVIDTAHASGLLSHFLDEPTLCMTIRGRLRSGSFNFRFGGHDVFLDGVQIEVDAGYEGNRVYLIEAKMGTRDNFIIRQLFYPLRMWQEKCETKEVVPIFLSYSDSVFYIYQYCFKDSNEYNSIELVKAAAYTLDTESSRMKNELKRYDSLAKLESLTPSNEKIDIPFPQADDIRRVIDIIFAVANGLTKKTDFADFYDFDIRQADYYGNAAQYLGFLTYSSQQYSLSEMGLEFTKSSRTQRRILMLKALMASPTINESVQKMNQINSVPHTVELAKIIKKYRNELNGTTPNRRASTVKHWLNWIQSNMTSNEH